MNSRPYLWPAIVFVAVIVVAVSITYRPVTAQEKSARAMPKWEYKLVKAGDFQKGAEESLNKLGDDGWECVGTVNDVQTVVLDAKRPAVGSPLPITTMVYFVCKRAKP